MNIKKRLLPALLAGLAFGFTFFFYGTFEIYMGNRDEFRFAFADFAPYVILAAFAAFAMVSLILLLLRGRVFSAVFGLVFWIIVMGYAQGNFLNFGMGSLVGDDVGTGISAGYLIFDTVLWLAAGVGCVFAAMKMKKHDIIRTAAVIILVTVCGMQAVGGAANAAKLSQSSPSEDDDTPAVLTTLGINEVSKNGNVIVFVLDRFDVYYYGIAKKYDADFFSPLDGFTYYDDNISLYSRTYPAITTMISGVDQDFCVGADEYFTYAYQNSGFLQDMKANGYRVGIYSADYYAYRDASSLAGVADNISSSKRYSITNTGKLTLNMLALSAYRYLPAVCKFAVGVSTHSFNSLVRYDGAHPHYELDDVNYYASLRENGLSEDENDKSFVFIHLNGCHQPYYMDADLNRVDGGSERDAVRGCFRAIYYYIDELKRLGLYDDATIIITGDHPSARSDGEVPTQPRLTSLFVKEAGRSGTPLAYSHAQVSQANLIPTIVKSAGVVTDREYGQAYSEVGEDEDTVRCHKFELYTPKSTHIVEFEITGRGSDFANWSIKSETDIGSLYE